MEDVLRAKKAIDAEAIAQLAATIDEIADRYYSSKPSNATCVKPALENDDGVTMDIDGGNGHEVLGQEGDAQHDAKTLVMEMFLIVHNLSTRHLSVLLRLIGQRSGLNLLFPSQMTVQCPVSPMIRSSTTGGTTDMYPTNILDVFLDTILRTV